jgi:hypothetical protein
MGIRSVQVQARGQEVTRAPARREVGRGTSIRIPQRMETGRRLDVNKVLNVVVMVLSAAVMLVGLLAIVGMLIPVYIPEQYRIIVGVVVFLYGLYRFVLSYFRIQRRES